MSRATQLRFYCDTLSETQLCFSIEQTGLRMYTKMFNQG